MKPLLTAIFLCVCCAAYSATNRVQVTLAWDASPDYTNGVLSYNVYYGTNSRAYTQMVSAGTNLTCAVSNLVTGVRYYFAATAQDAYGLESDYSEEVAYLTPVAPKPPGGMALVSVRIESSTNMVNWQTVTNLPAVYVGTTNGVKFFRSYMQISQ